MSAAAVLFFAFFLTLAVAPRAGAETFPLTINLVNDPNHFTVYNRVTVMDAATRTEIGFHCSTPFFTGSCTYNVNAGTAVRLIAVATKEIDGSGPMVARLSAGTGPAAACALSSCAFTMTAGATVTTTFTEDGSPMSSLTATIAGDALGRVFINDEFCDRTSLSAPKVCTVSYLTGSTVWLDADARIGGRFSGYSGATGPASTCGVDPHCEIALGANDTLTATFSALASVSVSPSSVVRGVGGPPALFTASGTYTDGVTAPLSAGPGRWSTAPPLPFANANHAAAALDGKVYSVGGLPISFDVSSAANNLVAFDPIAQTWTNKTSMTYRRNSPAAAVSGHYLYAIGGVSNASEVLSTVERYDPVSDSWLTVASMAGARRAVAAGTINGIIYAAGGAGATTTAVGTLEAYDPATDTWTPKAPMPTPRYFAAAGVVDGILYVVGGFSGTTPMSTVEAYDPATNTWTTKAPKPGTLGVSAGAVVDGVLYVMAGGSAYAYDPVADAWSAKAPLAPALGGTNRGAVAAASLNGIVYAIGGAHSFGCACNRDVNTVETFVDSLRWSSSARSVARIDQSGNATPIGPGNATIVANSGGLTCGSSCPTFTVAGPTTMSLDAPANGGSFTAGAELTIGGWALNTAAPSGTGVDTIHVYATPTGGSAMFLGVAPYGESRPDVGAIYGAQFTNVGYTLKTFGLTTAGGYTITAYGHNSLTDSFDVAKSAQITLTQPVSNPLLAVDTPAVGATVTSAFEIGGWAIDRGAPTGTGIDSVQFYVQLAGTPSPGVFVGTGTYGLPRPDVGAMFGSRFTNSGYHFTITGLGPGSYVLGVYERSTVTGAYALPRFQSFTVNATALMSIDVPGAEATIGTSTFNVDGWSIDRTVESTAIPGSGVDSLHVYAYPNPGSGAPPIFLGVATVGVARPDLAAIFGSRYANCGYHLSVDRSALGLGPGVYNIAVHSHSQVSNTFNAIAVIRITVQ